MPPTALAIVPVRGGSVGVPGKNMRPLAGRPLIWHTLQAAKQARSVADVYVATESEEIASFAQQNGVKVLMHSAELSGPTASTFPVIQQAVRRLSERYTIETYVTLRATSPFRTSDDIDDALATLAQHPKADS